MKNKKLEGLLIFVTVFLILLLFVYVGAKEAHETFEGIIQK